MNTVSSNRLPFKPQAVLFDLDGTLVETNIDFTAMKLGVLELAARHGLDETRLKNLDILGVVREAVAQLPRITAEKLKEEAEAFLMEIELQACRKAKPFPFAAELLNRLVQEQVKIGIVTRNCRASVEAVLSQYPLKHDLLLTRNDVAKTKPDPEHLLAALHVFQAEPGRSLMVGDHQMDIEGGKRAGMWTAGILLPDRPDDFFDDLNPDLIARNLQEVAEWIFPSF